MRALVQRVTRASVEVDGQEVAGIGPGPVSYTHLTLPTTPYV